MAQYNERIDQYIGQALALRGRLSADALAGLDESDGLVLLERYVALHPSDARMDGSAVVRIEAESVASGEPRLSPVDEILRAPVGASLLDSAPAGAAVPRWWWVLPLSLGLPGGLIAWIVLRSTNRSVARAMLVVSVVVTALSILTTKAFGPMLDALKGGPPGM